MTDRYADDMERRAGCYEEPQDVQSCGHHVSWLDADTQLCTKWECVLARFTKHTRGVALAFSKLGEAGKPHA